MANKFIRSTDGLDTDDGSTWALANATMVGSIADALAGDVHYVSASHSETQASGMNLAFKGTLAAPDMYLCVDDTGDPASPSTLATGAVVAIAGASGAMLSIGTGGISHGYVYGITFRSGSVSDNASIGVGYTGGYHLILDHCSLELGGNNASASIVLGSGSSSSSDQLVELRDTNVKFANTGQKMNFSSASVIWNGGAVVMGVSPVSLFAFGSGNKAGTVEISGVDFSACATTMNLIGAVSANGLLVLRDCKLPAGWTGNLFATVSTSYVGMRAEMYNCDAGDTNYRLRIEDRFGTIRDETTVVRTGGASDGTTPIAWKMTARTEGSYPTTYLRSGEIMGWVDSVGTALTATVEIVHDSAGTGTAGALTDKEAWLELTYLGTSGAPLAKFVSDAPATVLTAASDQASSSSTWTTTGLTTPVKQKLSVTFTPQEKGYVIATVCFARGASKVMYVDPMLTVA